jgi:tRNA1(Val) A37 N6-methylase TrmN6
VPSAGIVRAPRRPSGWRAPGPRPPGAPALGPRAGEDLCYLAGDWRILQRLDGHRWSLDDLVTAWYAARAVAERPPRRMLDLGCGIGTVLLLLAWRFPEAHGVGVEAQDVSVDLARRSLAWNGVAGRCAVGLADLREAGAVPERASFDLVTGTPPYLPPGTATASARVQCGPCHLEYRGGIEVYCDAAVRALAPGGRFVVCHSVPARVECAAAAAGLALVRRRDVVPRAGKRPLFAVHVLERSAEAGQLAIEPPLVVRDADGARTAEFRALRADMGMPP